MSSSPVISVQQLRKVYHVPVREPGLKAMVGSLFSRKSHEVVAVEEVSFSIQPGEIVGFLGANGAGKTTTLKMLTGILHPSGGEAHVLGHVPWKREKKYLRQISMVMGQRNQMVWDIPAADSFELNQAIYGIPDHEFRETLGQLTELLELSPLLGKPIRSLSLGERMKCELAASLLHRPKVLFLDEPTLGLDVTVQRKVRNFIRDYNRKFGTTVLLTSHYMADVEALCPRVMVIHLGKLYFDGGLDGLTRRFSPNKVMVLEFQDENAGRDLSRYGQVLEQTDGRAKISVPQLEAAAVARRLLEDWKVTDLTIEDPPIEEVVEKVFSHAALS